MISKTPTPKKYEVKIVREEKREREKKKKGIFFRVYEHANHIENNGGLMGNYVDLEAVVEKASAQESLYRSVLALCSSVDGGTL